MLNVIDKRITNLKCYKMLHIYISLLELIQPVLLFLCLKSNQSWFFDLSLLSAIQLLPLI